MIPRTTNACGKAGDPLLGLLTSHCPGCDPGSRTIATTATASLDTPQMSDGHWVLLQENPVFPPPCLPKTKKKTQKSSNNNKTLGQQENELCFTFTLYISCECVYLICMWILYVRNARLC